MNRKWRWKVKAALIRWRRWATAVKTRPGEKGLKLFVGSAKQMVQVPAGKRLLWALCLSNMWTQYKKGREVEEEEEEGVGGGLPANTPVPTQARECSTVASHNCKVWAETVGRRDDKTVSGHASKTLSQAAISPNCNDHVLREQRNISDIMVLWRQGWGTHSGMCVGLCALDAHQPLLRRTGSGPAITATVGRLL